MDVEPAADAAAQGPLFEVTLRGYRPQFRSQTSGQWLRAVLTSLPGVRRVLIEERTWEVVVTVSASTRDAAAGAAVQEFDGTMRARGWDQWRQRWPMTSCAATPAQSPGPSSSSG